MSRPAVFLDRDGTLNREVEGALRTPEELELLPGAAGALLELRSAGYALVVVTNQSAIARGWMRPDELAVVTRALATALAEHGAALDLVLACPHHPTEGLAPYRRSCACRKPGPGMLLEATRALDLDLARSWIVGDAARDLAAGRALDLPGILVGTGKGRAERERMEREGAAPEHFAPDVAAAAARILAAAPQGR